MNISRQYVCVVFFGAVLIFFSRLCAAEDTAVKEVPTDDSVAAEEMSTKEVPTDDSVLETAETGEDGQGGTDQVSQEKTAAEESKPANTEPETSEPVKQEFAQARLANAVMGKAEDREENADTKAKAEPLSPRQIAVWSLVSIASATLITGGIFGLAAGADKAQYEKNSDDELKSQATAKAIVSGVSFGIAGAAAVTAFILWITDRDGFESKGNHPNSQPVAFAIGVDGASVSIPF
jgi:hypothetical protein